jgi:aspartyl/asparaginyl-tRNA synthetase
MIPITCNSVSSPMGLGSDSLPVHVNLFGKETYLADSMQFYLEYFVRQPNVEGIWYIMPTFRGEDPDARHLNQFFHSEAEIKGRFPNIQKVVNNYLHTLTSVPYYTDKVIGDMLYWRYETRNSAPVKCRR